MSIYFDNAATTVVRDEAADAVLRVMRENYGNPSSMHGMGRAACGELADARKSVAEALGAKIGEVFFTSGGTEADNWAVFGSAGVLYRFGKHIITSKIEHSAVLEPIKKLEQEGWDVTYLDPDADGRIPVDSFAAGLRDDTVFASIMLVNNETGAANRLAEFSSEIKRRRLRTVFHSDAVQGFCKIPFTVKSLGVDLLSVSSHKLHGPMGAGALYIKESSKLHPLFFGGVQESKKRPGTEALPAIAGFGVAARLGKEELAETAASVRELREYVISGLGERLPELVVNGGGDSPFILNISLPGHKSEVLLNFLDSKGIYVTKGSACRKGLRSRVLEAMRLKNDIIDGALRVSFSRYSTTQEADCFIEALELASKTLMRSSRSVQLTVNS